MGARRVVPGVIAIAVVLLLGSGCADKGTAEDGDAFCVSEATFAYNRAYNQHVASVQSSGLPTRPGYNGYLTDEFANNSGERAFAVAYAACQAR